MSELDSLNKFITEKVLGECWHEWENISSEFDLVYSCKKCGLRHYGLSIGLPKKTDFTSEVGWWKLWNEARGREDWRQFVMETIADNGNVQYDYDTLDLFVDLQIFPRSYAKWHGWKGE